MGVDLILGDVLEVVRGARLIPRLEEVLAREKHRLELLGELAIWTAEPLCDFVASFTYWHLRTPYSWRKSYRICRYRIMADWPLPWQEGANGR